MAFPPPRRPYDDVPLPSSIGVASWHGNTLVLTLSASGPGSLIGDALIRYPPEHPQYNYVLNHIGGLKPGESKPVPPFPKQ